MKRSVKLSMLSGYPAPLAETEVSDALKANTKNLFQELFRASPQAMALVDGENIIATNAAAAALVGNHSSVSELSQLFSEIGAARLNEALVRAFEGEASYFSEKTTRSCIELRITLTPLTQLPGKILLNFNAEPAFRPEPRVDALQKTDRTQLKSEARIDLESSEQMFFWSARADGHTDYYESRLLQFTGRTLEEADPAMWRRVMHPEDAVAAEIEWEDACKNGTEFSAQFRVLRASDGVFRWCISRAVPVRNVSGAIERWHGVLMDIHERVLSEEVFKRQARESKAIMEVAPAGIVIAQDPQCRRITGNKASYELMRLPAERNISRSAPPEEYVGSFQILERGEVVCSEYLPLQRAARGEVVRDCEQEILFEDGFLRHILVNASPLYDDQGGIRGAIATFIDISERKILEKQRDELLQSERAARTQAERESRLKDEFLATLSHELRTPLNAILGWAQLLKRNKTLTEYVAQGIEVIEKNTRIQAQLIEDLLEMSRITSGKVRLKPELIDVIGVVQGAVDAVRPSALTKRIRLETFLSKEKILLRADSARLQQIIWNLLSNAVKFTPSSGVVTVTVSSERDHLRISIRDSGIGIKPDFLPYVFERFRQGDASTTRRFGGLGLGLAIVRQLVELHGGTVHGYSDGEKLGSEFVVQLPLHSEEVSCASAENVSVTSTLPVAEGTPLLSGVRILLVDDEEDSREVAKRVLLESDAKVITARSADEALAYLSLNIVDLIISDISMPEKDGYELMREIRSLHCGKAMRAIALTAFARSEDKQRAAAEGYDHHMAKPVEPYELLAVVHRLLRPGAAVTKLR